MSKIVIRKAAAQDAQACTPLIYSAGPELFDYIYSHAELSPQQFIEDEFKQGQGFMGHKLHWVAELDGEVVGVFALYSRKQLSLMNLATTAHILKAYGIKTAKPIKHALQAGSLISKPAKDGLHLANFGVSPFKRSSGIGSAMLQYAASYARQQGYSRVSLDVSVKNPRAQALYEKTGFEMLRENVFKGSGDTVPNGRLMVWTI